MPREHAQNVARHFDANWKAYDRQIRQVVPYYDHALTTMVEVIAATCPKPRLIVDLGLGTGNLSGLLLSRFPDARLVGVDLVQALIDQAEQRLAGHGDCVSLIRADVADFEFPLDCDVVVTSFMFHHLENPLKRRLFAQVYAALRSGGCFINLDFVHSGSDLYANVFDDLRIKAMHAQGVSGERIQTEYVTHRALEIPVPLETQVSWLAEAGFTDVECFWKYLNLAMFGGRKQSK
jgi:tRNA (cmo5U34)-methyltransferase